MKINEITLSKEDISEMIKSYNRKYSSVMNRMDMIRKSVNKSTKKSKDTLI